jgi:uncharacterized membrane protein
MRGELLMPNHAYLQADWRREAIRTNLWVVPAAEVVVMSVLFVVTYAIDRAAYHRTLHLPSWVLSGTADSARQILTTVAAAIITVVGIVFSITIVALTLTSTRRVMGFRSASARGEVHPAMSCSAGSMHRGW